MRFTILQAVLSGGFGVAPTEINDYFEREGCGTEMITSMEKEDINAVGGAVSMGKKRTLAIILLLCVLGGLIACGRKEKEDEYTYTIKLNDNASGSKQFSSCGYLWVYSVTDQMFTKYGNGEMPSSWTVGDTYIFFTTEQKNGGWTAAISCGDVIRRRMSVSFWGICRVMRD